MKEQRGPHKTRLEQTSCRIQFFSNMTIAGCMKEQQEQHNLELEHKTVLGPRMMVLGHKQVLVHS